MGGDYIGVLGAKKALAVGWQDSASVIGEYDLDHRCTVVGLLAVAER